ncbi:tRNA (adenosine(37)-N6)-threonylcarbamoyltransferase complex dimerization subunit type 1 TsaB [Abyssalbus ytuae]|uniref:tRNA (Adenosine(37)-N6)-threonylcarbamoyltransferase complex dimerization subunit type 1 TsaB n=1 Tax=Abyssalbus ytuae TaxID=2926907 RepID=A0A9E7A338_9FLAO|nr:tRNA (adenosine(37)-N6)-threonylcarbamoyltransferase complex dimerization subunit type 1 TsaB [Abyssalbus ytuae]UOB18966.1 tRNA (adenosine(37)-N6)-threonylcarbamoyltransferase complex dimerization subunit type 1 TsaB [Abyssalbus ytuae]
MAVILNLETSTTNCSVSIGKDGNVIALREVNNKNYTHSENLHVFIQEVLEKANISVNNLEAIAVSKGPGSYTGLRIGVSAAKGLCYALNKPLISVATLQVLAQQLTIDEGSIISLLDARRMEVYSAVFDKNYNEIRKTNAEIITESSFVDFLEKEKVYFIGPGAEKCKDIIKHSNAVFPEITHVPSAREMAALAELKYKKSDFEDVAYFEPYYLKDFVTVTPGKKTK